MTFATLEHALETLDDWSADNPLDALRLGYAKHLTDYRLDAIALAEPAAALVHAFEWLSPEQRARCAAAARVIDLKHYVPDRLSIERRRVIAIARGDVT